MSETKPPTRQERKHCWFVRDQYFACLDTLNINDPTIVEKNPEKATKCLDLKKGYEEGCMASWVNIISILYKVCCYVTNFFLSLLFL